MRGTDGDEVRLVDAGYPDDYSTTSLHSGNRHVSTVVAVAILVAVVGLALGVAFGRGATADGAGPGDSGSVPSTTTVPSPTGSSTTTVGRSVTTTDPAPEPGGVDDGAASPEWFDEPAPWAVLIRTLEGLVRIDLESGEVAPLRWSGFPVANTGTRLVFQNQFGQLISVDPGAFDGASPPAEPAPLSETYASRSTFWVGTDADEIWVRPWEGRPVVWRVDLAAGREEPVQLPAAIRTEPTRPGGSGSLEWASPASGGVFRLVDGSYERVADGSVVVASRNRLLVERCGAALECRWDWLDPATLEPTGFPDVPLGDAAIHDPVIAGQGNVVIGEAFAADIETGRRIPLSRNQLVGLRADRPTVAISPDGRWTLDWSAEGFLTVKSLTSGEVRLLELRIPTRGNPIFVAKPDGGAPVG